MCVCVCNLAICDDDDSLALLHINSSSCWRESVRCVLYKHAWHDVSHPSLSHWRTFCIHMGDTMCNRGGWVERTYAPSSPNECVSEWPYEGDSLKVAHELYMYNVYLHTNILNTHTHTQAMILFRSIQKQKQQQTSVCVCVGWIWCVVGFNCLCVNGGRCRWLIRQMFREATTHTCTHIILPHLNTAQAYTLFCTYTDMCLCLYVFVRAESVRKAGPTARGESFLIEEQRCHPYTQKKHFECEEN